MGYALAPKIARAGVICRVRPSLAPLHRSHRQHCCTSCVTVAGSLDRGAPPKRSREDEGAIIRCD
eukprot:10198540-Alexandrium_andersonii.AAC.2